MGSVGVRQYNKIGWVPLDNANDNLPKANSLKSKRHLIHNDIKQRKSARDREAVARKCIKSFKYILLTSSLTLRELHV